MLGARSEAASVELLLCRICSGAMCVWLFAVVALELKYRAPHAHTMLECVEVRWGRGAHIVSSFPHWF